MTVTVTFTGSADEVQSEIRRFMSPGFIVSKEMAVEETPLEAVITKATKGRKPSASNKKVDEVKAALVAEIQGAEEAAAAGEEAPDVPETLENLLREKVAEVAKEPDDSDIRATVDYLHAHPKCGREACIQLFSEFSVRRGRDVKQEDFQRFIDRAKEIIVERTGKK